jgi:diketogulonate reductase-like aldo/keto reductase
MPVRRKRTRKLKLKGGNPNNKKNTNKNKKVNAKPLEEMPQLCFGTVQYGLPWTLPMALELGYRHIDGAEKYERIHAEYGLDYKETIKQVLSQMKAKIKRNELWITWKDNSPTLEKIQESISKLGCEYFDLFLIHHSCGIPDDFTVLQEAQKMGLIRYFGVSNCETIENIRFLKERYNIYANQIQARPPGGDVAGRQMMEPDFIAKCNALGVRVMLFSSISSISMLLQDNLLKSANADFLYKNIDKINKYYIQKFLRPFNVLMVASQTGSTLEPNLIDVRKFLSGAPLLSEDEMKMIEEYLLSLSLAYT